MLHHLLAAVALGCVTVAQYSPDSHLRGILFEPTKPSRTTRILSNHQRPPIHGYSNSGQSDPSEGSQPSSRDPFTSDKRDPFSSARRDNPSSDPFSFDDDIGRHHPHNNLPVHSSGPEFGSGIINNNRYPQGQSPAHQRRLVHPQQGELHSDKPFGNFGNRPVSKKSSNDDFDLLSHIAPIHGLSDTIDGVTSKHAQHQQRDPFSSENRHPSHNHFGNDRNQQYPDRNPDKYHPAQRSIGFQPPPAYARNRQHQEPTYTSGQSTQYPTDNHDKSRPNPPTPSIPTFGQPLAPPTEFVPTHRHIRNNGPPNQNNDEYRGPENSPTSSRSYQPSPNQRPYSDSETFHGQQNPSYVHNPSRGDNAQGQSYGPESHPHQRQQYPDSDPYKANQYEPPSSKQGDDPRDPPGNGQYHDPRSSERQQHPTPGQHPQYPGPNSHQYPAPSDQKEYPDNQNNQRPQSSGSTPDQDQPYSNQNHGNSNPNFNEQPYQQNQDSKPAYPVPTHNDVHEDPHYVPTQGIQDPNSRPHPNQDYPRVESQPSTQYTDQQPKDYNPLKTSPAQHIAPDSYPPQHPGVDSLSAVHNHPDLEHNKNQNGIPVNRYPGDVNTDHALASTPSAPSYPPVGAAHSNKGDYPENTGGTPKGNTYPETASNSYPQGGNTHLDNEHSPQYPTQVTAEHGSYPDKSYPEATLSHPDNVASSYPDSNLRHSGTIEHPTSYPNKGTHQKDSEYPGLHPAKPLPSDSGSPDYQSTYPTNGNTGSAEQPPVYPDKTTTRTGDEHPGGHQAAAEHHKKNTLDYQDSYPSNINPSNVDHPISDPNPHHSVVDQPTSYPDTTRHGITDEHPVSGTGTHADDVEHPTSYPDQNTHQTAAQQSGSYPVHSDHAGRDGIGFPGKNNAVLDSHPTSYPRKTVPGVQKHTDSYSPVTTDPDSAVHSTSYPDKVPHHVSVIPVHLDSHLHKPHNEHPSSYKDITHSNPAHQGRSFSDKLALDKAKQRDAFSPKPSNQQSDSYPLKVTNTHPNSFPTKEVNSHLGSYPPKGTNPSASSHADVYPDIQSSSEQDHPKPHVNPPKFHSKFPRNRYPEGVGVNPSYPAVNQKRNNVIKHDSVNPESHPTIHTDPVSETRKAPRQEVVKPNPSFIPPGLQGQCFRYSDPSAGYGLSDNTFGYPENEIAAEIRARPFLAPILGYKNFAQPRNQFDVNQLGLSGYNRNAPLSNNYLYSRKDYPAGYKEGDFEKPTPREFSCRMTTKPLRMFKLYGGRCWAVNPDFKKVTYRKCGAPGDYCSAHRGRCSEDHDWVEVWSFCEKAPQGQRTKPRKLYLPVGCSCKSYYC